MTRRKFSRDFKIEAVRLVTDRGVAVAQAARDLDVAESVLRRWMRELATAPVAAFLAVRSAGCVAVWLPRLAQSSEQRPRDPWRS